MTFRSDHGLFCPSKLYKCCLVFRASLYIILSKPDSRFLLIVFAILLLKHVGWWSPTIIRADDREAVHIPNHKFTVNVVRNLSQKTHWRIKTHLAISHLDVGKVNVRTLFTFCSRLNGFYKIKSLLMNLVFYLYYDPLCRKL